MGIYQVATLNSNSHHRVDGMAGNEQIMLFTPIFKDRTQAGEQLAKEILLQISLEHPNRDTKIVVYALPRGGVPVAVPIAQGLQAPLSVIVAKKSPSPITQNWPWVQSPPMVMYYGRNANPSIWSFNKGY